MEKIAIITAMESEFKAVLSLYNFTQNATVDTAKAHGCEIILIKSGMGKVNAALATQKAFQLGAQLVINTGLAGGIDPKLDRGDIVLARQVCYHDVWCGEPNALGQVQDMPLYYDAPDNLVHKVISDQLDYKSGLIVTGDQFLTDKQRLKEIKEAFPKALAVDMESAAVAQVCYLNQIPYLSLRIISDVVGKESQLEQYNNFWQQVPHKASKMLADVLALILK